ncbi:hypothetical protein FMM79_17035 [Novosphingobium sp. BW1]|nr:hypothetical protein FMM79_17035 [Novosphingobium sp. BW1]
MLPAPALEHLEQPERNETEPGQDAEGLSDHVPPWKTARQLGGLFEIADVVVDQPVLERWVMDQERADRDQESNGPQKMRDALARLHGVPASFSAIVHGEIFPVSRSQGRPASVAPAIGS